MKVTRAGSKKAKNHRTKAKQNLKRGEALWCERRAVSAAHGHKDSDTHMPLCRLLNAPWQDPACVPPMVSMDRLLLQTIGPNLKLVRGTPGLQNSTLHIPRLPFHCSTVGDLALPS